VEFPHNSKKVDVSIKILDIIHRPVSYIKHDVSENAFCLRLRVEPGRRVL
jgi:hypothetical protein